MLAAPLRTATTMMALGVALAGCNSHKTSSGTATPAGTRTKATAAPTPASAGPSPAAKAAATASGAAGAKTCISGHTSAMIGGASKCLAPSQQCSSKHINDYPQYGYTCEQSGTRYILKKKT